MRAYLAKRQEQPSPFKAYYLTRMYRYARPQEGRYREHRQFGIEVFGAEDPGADAEVITVGDAFLRGLGLVRISCSSTRSATRLSPRVPGGADRVPP